MGDRRPTRGLNPRVREAVGARPYKGTAPTIAWRFLFSKPPDPYKGQHQPDRETGCDSERDRRFGKLVPDEGADLADGVAAFRLAMAAANSSNPTINMKPPTANS